MAAMKMSCYYFPEEVIIEFLLRLPSKSLVRFRSVSRSWHTLISSPAFVSSHVKHHTKHNNSNHTIAMWVVESKHLFLLQPDQPSGQQCSAIKWPVPNKLHLYSVHLCSAGSCYGLVCLYDLESIYLWNPSIKRCLRVLQRHIPKPNVCLSMEVVGLGYDEMTNDHKVVLIEKRFPGSFNKYAKVYSLNSKKWKEIERPTWPCLDFSWPAYVNGMIHWGLQSCSPSEDAKNMDRQSSKAFSILTFDVHGEVFGRMMLPQKTEFSLLCHMSVVDGLLASIQWDHRAIEWSVWVMKDYQDTTSWTRILKISGLHRRIGRVICVRTNNEVLILRYNEYLKCLQWASPRALSSGYTVHAEYPFGHSHYWLPVANAYVYVDSLVLL